MVRQICFTVYGSPQSKANSRRAVFSKRQGRMMFIKSKKALEYVDMFLSQCPNLKRKPEGLISGNVHVQIDIWYRTSMSDLDESIILDCMQELIYVNDRQVKQKLITHMGVDRANPRANIIVTELVD